MSTMFVSTVVSFYSFCLRHVHFTALLIGSAAYIGYAAASSLRWPTHGSRGDATARKKAEASSGFDDGVEVGGAACRHWTTVFPGALVWVVVAMVVASVSGLSWSRRQEEMCATWQEGLQLDLHLLDEQPRSQQQSDRAWSTGPASGSRSHRGRVQQRVGRVLAEAGVSITDDVATPVAAATEDTEGSCNVAGSPSAEAQLVSWNARCEAIKGDLRSVRKGKAPISGKYSGHGGAIGNALSLLLSLQRLEAPFVAATQAAGIESRSSASVCLLEALQEARLLAAALPQHDKLVQQAQTCAPDLLKNVEATAVAEAEKVSEPSTTFALGLYWSEIGVATAPAPLFGAEQLAGGGQDAGWADDAVGGSSKRVPAAVARAEALLKAGEEATANETARADRGATRALRLYQHAKSLALLHHDDAAESRYLAAAQAAAATQRAKLASHSLTRLAYFLSLRGRHHRALAVAQQALLHSHDPLAIYLTVTIRRTLGDLKTDQEVAEAEGIVASVAGQLPSQALEQQRAALEEELRLWRRAAAEEEGSCLALHDVARVLLCFVGRLVFEPSSAPPPPQLIAPEARPQKREAVFED